MARKTIAQIEEKRAAKLAENQASIPALTPPVTPAPSLGWTLEVASQQSGLTIWNLRTQIWNRKLPAQLHGKRIIVLPTDVQRFLLQQPPIHSHSNPEMVAHLNARSRARKRAA